MTEYHVMMIISPLAVTRVNDQLYIHPMIKATTITAIACMSDESLSDIPSCSILAVMVMMAEV
jgi:hypothetical protein